MSHYILLFLFLIQQDLLCMSLDIQKFAATTHSHATISTHLNKKFDVETNPDAETPLPLELIDKIKNACYFDNSWTDRAEKRVPSLLDQCLNVVAKTCLYNAIISPSTNSNDFQNLIPRLKENGITSSEIFLRIRGKICAWGHTKSLVVFLQENQNEDNDESFSLKIFNMCSGETFQLADGIKNIDSCDAGFAFSQDDSLFAYSVPYKKNAKQTISLVNLSDKIQQTIALPEGTEVKALAFDPTANLLAMGIKMLDEVLLYNRTQKDFTKLDSNTKVHTVSFLSQDILLVGYTVSGFIIYKRQPDASYSHLVKIRSFDSYEHGDCWCPLPGSIAFSSDKKRIAHSSHNKKGINLINLDLILSDVAQASEKKLWYNPQEERFLSDKQDFCSLVFAVKNNYLIIGGHDGKLYLWGCKEKKVIQEITLQFNPCIRFLKIIDNNLIINDNNGTVQLFNLDNLLLAQRLLDTKEWHDTLNQTTQKISDDRHVGSRHRRRKSTKKTGSRS